MKNRPLIAKLMALVVLLGANLSAGVLERREIRDAGLRGAICNDFSHAIYYSDSSPASTRWIIYFEGGGGCSSFEECNQRWVGGKNRPLMSSMDFPSMVNGEDILSKDPANNPLFHSHSHVLVPYCSSDAWLANKSNPRFDRGEEFRFNESTDADNFAYKGRAIFQAIIEDLIDNGLANASELILAGSSSGGVGILNYLEWLQEQLEDAHLLILMDSSWFIPFEDYHAINWSLELAQILGITQKPCLDLSLGFPCCTSPHCLLSKEYLPTTIPPIFAVSSTYDIFTLQVPLSDEIGNQGSNNDDQALLRLFNSYGALMSQSFQQSYSIHPNLSFFTPSCSQHVYFATSSLWHPGELLNGTADGAFTETVFRLTNPIRNGNWDQVRIVGEGTTVTLHEAIQEWYKFPTTQAFYTDSCSGPVCGECPGDIALVPERNTWTVWLNSLVLVLAALPTILAISMKLTSYLQMKYLLYCQKVYAYSVQHTVRNRPHFPKATHAVNVSCTDLYYRIDIVNKPKLGDAKQHPQSAEHYQLYTKMETFVPCFKRLSSNCFGGLSSTVCKSNKGHNSPLNVERLNSSITASVPSSNSSESGATESHSFVSVETNQSGVTGNIKKKTILRRVNLYFNPGELVAIMGPSGSGKTTLLDVLLGRRTAGTTDGNVYINGIPLSKMRNWFVVNSGYVRQLATSFYNELTVRENLLFSMNMQAPQGMKLKQKLERVEQVLRETGLQEQGDVKVGDGVGLGISGGQRKRLAIAVQLLSMPNIIFLDEPTSGLDSASSLEILKRLQVLAETGRAVVVTIHQPRSEIFLAFDKILLLCNGQVAFFGSPIRVWDFFTRTIDVTNEELQNVGAITNHADAILDLLKGSSSQKRVLRAYNESGEPKKVKDAVIEGTDDGNDVNSTPVYSPNSRYPGFWYRLMSLESRASLRQNIFSIIYLPIVYVIFGTILGTTYLFTDNAVQIMSVTCLLSCSSSLFMSSIVLSLLVEPLKLFQLEHSDGIACAHELILQVFIRMSAICTLPLAVCVTMVFTLVYQNTEIEVYLVVLLAFLLVNQAWISLFILLTVSYPTQAHRLCPVFAAAGGFCCGFIIPKPLMPVYYRWIFYINPSYYSYAATTVVVLEGNDLGCEQDSPLECFRTSNVAVLDEFGLGDVNPILNLVVLIAMVVVLLLLGVTVLQTKVTFPIIKEKIVGCFCTTAKWRRQKRRRVHSTSEWAALDDVDVTTTPVELKGKKTSSNTVVDQTDSRVELMREEVRSSEFLEQGKHQLFHNFPWERLMSGEDTVDGGMYPLYVPVKPPATDTVETERRLPAARVKSPEQEPIVPPSEIIEMEERDEEERQRVATRKWNQRREKMESEFLRLRHYYRTMAKVKRHHSVSECSFDLDFGQEDERRIIRSSDVGCSPGQSRKTSLSRSHSVPAGQHSRVHQLATIETHDEDFDDGMEFMGLPPKDIPNMVSESIEQLDRLDIADIPEEIVDMGDWNTEDNYDL